MRLRHIELLNAIMLTGSVSAAARLVHITQPAASRTLQHAELQLGFALFQRTRNRLVPTAEALALYPLVERLFAQLDEVQRTAAGLRAAGAGEALRVLTVPALASEVLPRALVRFRRTHADVRVAVETAHSAPLMAALLRLEGDIGFVFGATPHPALVATALDEVPLVCVAPRGLLARPGDSTRIVRLVELDGEPLIGLDARDPVGVTLAHALGEAGMTQLPALSVQTYLAALAMAHHGLGIALVDECTARSADRSRVDVFALEPRLAVPVWAMRPASRPDSVLCRALARCVAQAVAEPTG